MRNTETSLAQRRALLKHIWQWIRIAPLPLTVTLLLRITNAISNGVQPIFIAGFTNALINAEELFLWSGMYLGSIILVLLTDLFNGPTQMWFSNKAILHFQNRILQQAAQTPLIQFLDPDFHDILNRATHGFSDRIISWFQSLLHNIHGIATTWTLISAVLIIGGGMKCVLVLLACSIVISLTRNPIAKLEVEEDRVLSRPRREINAWSELLHQRRCSAEIRLFSIQRWLLSKWTDAYKKLAAYEINLLKKATVWNAIATLTSILGYCSIIFIAADAAHNATAKETAGIFTGLITAAVALQVYFSSIVGGIANLSIQSTILRELIILLDVEDTTREDGVHMTKTDTDSAIELDSVSFIYPRATRQTLKNISVKIKEGETIALVGKNGSGKTTLAYLLLGLYEPDSGNLSFSENNIPTKSAVFQDFVKFRLPIRDNVGFADLNRLHDDAHLKNTLQRAGSTFVQELDTWLGQEFGGIDISGGEWVRIAVARGLFRDSNLIVFDEPTASIDPVEEVNMVSELLKKQDVSRTTIVISHRLGVARLCNRILVLDEGQLVENGTHTELIDKKGLYAEMWNAQARWYT